MNEFCDCENWRELKKDHEQLFVQDPSYGWVLSWIEVTEEKTHSQIHRFGVGISYCPLCGKKLGD